MTIRASVRVKLNLCRWASEQAKARELGDVVEFARDLKLV